MRADTMKACSRATRRRGTSGWARFEARTPLYGRAVQTDRRVVETNIFINFRQRQLNIPRYKNESGIKPASGPDVPGPVRLPGEQINFGRLLRNQHVLAQR